MSKNYSTSSTFHSFNGEAKIRQIIQEELLEFFSEIKIQIQAKIKKIDVNINELKAKIDKIDFTVDKHLQSTVQQLNDFEVKIQVKNQELQELMNNSRRSRSFEKEKNTLFKKSNNTIDLDTLLFGQSKQIKPSPPQIESKPPLPKQTQKPPETPKEVIEEVKEKEQEPKNQKLKESLNKNKNSFMRKKSEKKLATYVIEEESVEQSILSVQ